MTSPDCVPPMSNVSLAVVTLHTPAASRAMERTEGSDILRSQRRTSPSIATETKGVLCHRRRIAGPYFDGAILAARGQPLPSF
eukprot:scaffold281749_cov40-Tisochrysis_lutea.AAC.2